MGLKAIRIDDNEFCAFIDVMRCLGVEMDTIHQLDKERWQEIINQGGYNITSLACWGFCIGSLVFIFSTGKPDWTGPENKSDDPDDHLGRGEDGSLLMIYDTATKTVIPRRHLDASGKRITEATFVNAMPHRTGSGTPNYAAANDAMRQRFAPGKRGW